MLAKDIMTRKVACCDPDTSLLAAAQLMKDEDCGSLPVTNGDNEVIGLVTDRDLVCRGLADGLDPLVSTVGLVMTTPAETIDENTSIDDCVRRLADKQIRRLVVMDAEGCCCGIITQGDIAREAPVQETGSMVKEISQPDAGEPERREGREGREGGRQTMAGGGSLGPP